MEGPTLRFPRELARRLRRRMRLWSLRRTVRRRTSRWPEEGPPVTVVIDVPAGSPEARRAARRLSRTTAYRDRSLVFGRSAAHGDLLCFLSPGVRPLHREWLGAMVSAIAESPEMVAVAPIVVGADGRGRAGYRPGWFRGVPGGAPITIDDPAALPSERREVAAADGLCLLVRRDAFEAVGGWDDGYREAWGDIDLCARLRRDGGRLVVTTDALVLHDAVDHRSRPGADDDRARFAQRWAVALGRQARAAYADLDAPVSAVVGSRDLDVPAPFILHGIERQPSADRLVVTDPRYERADRVGATVKVAVAGPSLEAWENGGFDGYDVVAVGDASAVHELSTRIAPQPVALTDGITPVWDAARRSTQLPRIAWRIGSPPGREGERWGDTHLARHLAAALREQGFVSTITPLPFWDHPAHQAVDVAVHLHGLSDYRPKPGHLNVLWVISHPERVTAEMAERFDLVLVASMPFAEELAGRLAVPVRPFLQATNTHLFRPRDRIRDIPVLFVGNSRRRERPMVRWALEAGLPLTVYGGDWEGIIPDEVVAARFVPNHLLPELYSRAQVVLNDHWPDMAEQGFVSNRIFDVAATGTPMVTDPVAGLDQVMGNAVPVVTDAASLRETVDQLLVPGSGPDDGPPAAFKQVQEHHSMRARAVDFIAALLSMEDSRAAALVDRRAAP